MALLLAPFGRWTLRTKVEDRSRTCGISNKARRLVVIHTERRNGIRIISARKATRYEKGIYQNG
ncbi:BrnT family toxin [Polaromonas sp.]|uniref:BrnT family toxin n=1 Tax=Polaromonas sp. TaxID=1869339 RepID=UPI0018473EF9|nr:BrnT family toxin [Polaromonas sp.]